MNTETLLLLKKRLKAMQKQINKTFVNYDSVSNVEWKIENHNYKVVYQNTTDDYLADSNNLFNLLRQADLLIQKMNEQEINIVNKK